MKLCPPLALGLGLGLALLLLLDASTARAQSFPIELVGALAPEKKTDGAAAVTLVGRSGQIYAPAGAGVWRRREGGGIALDVTAAVRRPGRPAEVIAVGGGWAPPFRYAAGTWRAEPLSNRGRTVMSATGPVPALAVGRHIYTWDKDAWTRRTAGPAKVTAVWAASSTSILVAGADGTLTRLDRGRSAPVRTGLPVDDPIVLLIGAAPNQVYGRTQGGAWLRIDRAGTARVTLAQELTGFDEQAAGLGPDGALWLAGSVPADAGARRTVLARADKNRILVAEALAAPADGDRYAVVWGTAATGELLVATRGGALRLRARDGTWTEGRVSGELPPAPARRGAGPARAR